MPAEAQNLETVADRLQRMAEVTLGSPSENADECGSGCPWGLSRDSIRTLRDPLSFRDERGNARCVDRLLLMRIAARLRVSQEVLVDTDSLHQSPQTQDVLLWRMLARNDRTTDAKPLLVGNPEADADDGPAPALVQPEQAGLEVWTETELQGLHALWWLAHERDDAWLSRRIDRARAWLVEHIQPDNATNTPWAVHVFAIAAAETNDAVSDLFAGQLVHNSIVGSGSPDRRSAWVLLDAAAAIRAHLARRRS